MQFVTLLLGLFASAMVNILRRPGYALCVYVGTLAWYPSYLTAKLGVFDFNIGRITIMAIFFRILKDKRLLANFEFIVLDYLVIAAGVAATISGLITSPAERFLEYQAGATFDTILPYFAVRLLLRSRQDYIEFLKGVLVLSVPLAIIGAYQCLTYYNPFGFLKQYHAWTIMENIADARYNLCRADVTFSHSIMFGFYFAIVGPWCLGLWYFVPRSRRVLITFGIIAMLIGLMSSMSSGPQLAGAGLFFALILFPFRKYWRILLAALILLMVLVEVGSNRRWYYVASSYLAFNADTAYYRCRLIEYALGGGMAGHWIVGYGFKDPGWWEYLNGSALKGTDVTNHYIAVVVQYGLVGLLPFIAVLVSACKMLRKGFERSLSKADKWLVWCVLASLAGTLLGMFSVSLFGQPVNLFYMTLGLCGVMPLVVSKPWQLEADLSHSHVGNYKAALQIVS